MSSRQVITEAAEKADWGPDKVVAVLCDYIDRQEADAAFGDHVRKCVEEDTEEPDAYARRMERHSVNCYFCNTLTDERECISADKYSGGDGGSLCQNCALFIDDAIDAVTYEVQRGRSPEELAKAGRADLEAATKASAEKHLPFKYQKAVDVVAKAAVKRLNATGKASLDPLVGEIRSEIARIEKDERYSYPPT